MTQITYRGWAIEMNFIGEFEAVSPNYDAWWENGEDGWVDNGQKVTSRTLEGVREEVDAWIKEHAE